MFVKVGASTWFNTDTITKVEEIRSRSDPTRINVFLADRSGQPVTLTDKTEVEAFLAWLDRASQPAAKITEKPKLAA